MYGELTALSINTDIHTQVINTFQNYITFIKTVSTWISHLKKGYIDTVVIRDKNMTVTERRIYITVPYPSNYGEGYPKKVESLSIKDGKNNTRENNTRE